MKSHKNISDRQETLAEQRLAEALLTMRTVTECRAFLRDLCSPGRAAGDGRSLGGGARPGRGLPYREIHGRTGVSVTTIGRVARYLALGNGGYALAARSASGRARMDEEPRLKLAVQKSGRLTDPSLDLLSRCGLKLARGKDQLVGFGENLPLDVLFVRDDDIPDLVQEDVCDLGLVGLNVLEERQLELPRAARAARFEKLRDLDFGRCRLSIAAPARPASMAPNRCAASASRPPTLHARSLT
jgi:uncharacterized protein YerC